MAVGGPTKPRRSTGASHQLNYLFLDDFWCHHRSHTRARACMRPVHPQDAKLPFCLETATRTRPPAGPNFQCQKKKCAHQVNKGLCEMPWLSKTRIKAKASPTNYSRWIECVVWSRNGWNRLQVTSRVLLLLHQSASWYQTNGGPRSCAKVKPPLFLWPWQSYSFRKGWGPTNSPDSGTWYLAEKKREKDAKHNALLPSLSLGWVRLDWIGLDLLLPSTTTS
jgi:hypothetical protein